MLLAQGPELERLISGLGAGFVLTIWAVLVLHWIFDELISVVAGLISIFAVVPLLYLAVYPPHPAVQYAILLVVVATIAFLPQAFKFWNSQENKRVDLHPLERGYGALATKPDNVQAAFEIAKWLADSGYVGDAIAIATPAANSLSPEQDPMTNRSIRDLFRTELLRLKDWESEPHAQPTPKKCPQCQSMNPPGKLFCQKCGGPFVLLLARGSLGVKKDMGRLIVGWSTTALIIGLGATYATTNPDTARIGVAVICVAGGAVLWWTFRSRAPLR